MRENMENGSIESPSAPFDRIARRYDEFVLSMDDFPYAGYERVLEEVVRQAQVRSGMRVLDLGIGTGNLAKRLTDVGCHLWGIDFSAAMLDEARVKVPEAVLVPADLLGEWLELGGRFDRVVSSYAFHHFELAAMIGLLCRVARDHVLPSGLMVIADLAFDTVASRDEIRQAVGKAWEEEHYWVAAETLPKLREYGLDGTYSQVSSCAGVFKIKTAQHDATQDGGGAAAPPPHVS